MATDDEILAELKQIKELLTAKPPPPPPKGMVSEFKAFLSQYKVLGLAVAFILGVYLGALVQALVKDLVLPVLGIPLGSANQLTNLQPVVYGQVFYVGDFLNAAITFVLVAFVVFLIVKMANRYKIQ